MDAAAITTLSLEELIRLDSFPCTCGKTHSAGIQTVLIEKGAIAQLPQLLAQCGGKKPFLLSGPATFAAAGDRVCSTLEEAGIPYCKYIFPTSPVPPTEHSVGSAVMHFDFSCDVIIGIGSGVINDIGKILANTTGRTYIIVGTAPSMDGYASASSSMERDGLKVSLDSTCPWAVVGDLDVLCQAPMHMLQAGLGDMLAKYVSLCEWRIAHILVDEYYCPVVAALVETALDRCVRAGNGLIRREPEAVKAVMEGMVIAGMAMKYAGLSRPASGMEHYFSHIWDMRSLAFGTGADLHGIQCGVATLLSLKIYEFIRTLQPDRETAQQSVARFSQEDWNRQLLEFIGPGAQAMILGEVKEGKYDLQKHALRLERIFEVWPQIQAEVNKLPSYEQIHAFLTELGAPVSAGDFGVSDDQIRTSFTMTKDIRDKYIASRLLWDLGQLEDAAQVLPQDAPPVILHR